MLSLSCCFVINRFIAGQELTSLVVMQLGRQPNGAEMQAVQGLFDTNEDGKV